MAPIDEPASFEAKPPESPEKRLKPRSETESGASDFITITIEAASGRVVRVEGADAAGARRELSGDDKSRMLAKAEGAVEDLVERAFEAGLEFLLDQESEDEAELESELESEDAELRRLLLRSLMAGATAKRLMQREALSRAIAGTLIKQAVGAEGGRTH